MSEQDRTEDALDNVIDEEDLDEEPENDDVTIRAKWAMDGATTLSEAADMLERYAATLRAKEAEGWQLSAAVEDDYGFIQQAGTPG